MDESLPNDDFAEPRRVLRQPNRSVMLPLILFVATCWSTGMVGGLSFSLAIMTTLLAHELGHFLQALRYRVPASWPYFIPMPASPIGTMGAVILMQPGMGNRRSLFDIAITGPLAGLVPALLFSFVGLHWSQAVEIAQIGPSVKLGEPILFKLLVHAVFGALPDNQEIVLHPVAFAGWVGIFITALNLIPIGQLDGGHILYSLLLRRSHGVAQLVMVGAMLGVVYWGYWGWTLMLLLLMLMGPVHPPTADDTVPLSRGRTVLGWLSLAFVPLGFTPVPFAFGM